MLFRFRCFGSGSSGNCYYIETDEGGFFIDAGIAIRRLKKFLADYGVSLSSIKAILLTHDHSDHVKCIGAIEENFQIPIYATHGVISGIMDNPTIRKKPVLSMVHYLVKDEPVNICSCTVTPFTVPHDSCDNVGYLIEYQGHSFCFITDAGHITEGMVSYISQTDQLIIESNYDERMLEAGGYPYYLKNRIVGENGHLSNDEAAELIYQHLSHLRHIWLCHLSGNNNTPDKAVQTVENFLLSKGIEKSDLPHLEVLRRNTPSDLFDL